MNQDTLTQLGLTPATSTHITGQQRTRLVSFLLRWSEFEATLACLDEMLAQNPGLVSLLDAKARALLGLEQADAALQVLQERHKLRVSQPSRALEARIHLALGNPGEALRLAYDLVSENPASALAWGLMGEVHLARQDHDAALSAYRRLADLRPNSRTYLLGMLAFHQAQANYVTASGYAVRLQRSGEGDHPLPARTLRKLRDYYQDSGEPNRAQDVQAALAQLYQTQLADLHAALSDDLRLLTPTPPEPAEPDDSSSVPRSGPSSPAPASISVSPQERRQLERAARKFFGHASLLPGQAETLVAATRGQDVLTILPTGGGKSLCYQLPALLDESGTTLVISPLIALMKDQVDSLPPEARQQATTINSSLEGDELESRMRDVADGYYRLVYAAPERLRQTGFLHALRRAGVRRLVIDEAHCVSSWGHDFRPDYLYIAQARQALGDPALLAMTATAPTRVRRDILQRLTQGEDMAVVAGESHRPNLYLAAARARNADEKLRYLLALCQAEQGSGIVYAGTRERCEQIAATLRERGIAAGYYHAGIGDRVARAAAQDNFMSGRVRVMVATIAFGMGVDKSDIRFIIHFQLPSSLEAYYQEAGRAGRDGQPARCTLLYSLADRATLTRRARRDALKIEFLRRVYLAVRRRLGGAQLGGVASDDLLRDLQVEDTPLRVALSMLEEAGLLRRHRDTPRYAAVRMLQKNAGPDWSAFASAARLQLGRSIPLDLLASAQAAGLDPADIEAQLLAWADAGWLDLRTSGRDMLLELLPAPADAATQVEAMIDRYASIQMQRVDEIASYAATRRCRHGHISAYLGGRSLEQCRACDNCRPASSTLKRSVAQLDLPDERQQLALILRCIANTRGGWGQANLVHILRGSARASQAGKRSEQWKALSFRSRSAVEGLVSRLLGAEMLRQRQLEHGGIVLELTPAGRAALKDPAKLEPLLKTGPPSPPPELAQADAPSGPLDEGLHERLKAWRRDVAQAAGVPLYVVAHNSLLQQIAAARPRNAAELAALKGMGPKRLEQYGVAILKLVREHSADEG